MSVAVWVQYLAPDCRIKGFFEFELSQIVLMTDFCSALAVKLCSLCVAFSPFSMSSGQISKAGLTLP